MATLINLTTKHKNKKSVSTIGGVNPNATESDIQEFTTALNELSEDELIKIEKVEKTLIDLGED